MDKTKFHISVLKAWSKLPTEIKKNPSLHQFKRKLKKHLMSSINPN